MINSGKINYDLAFGGGSRMSNQPSPDFGRFDEFLLSNNIELREFYNHLFQFFFYHGGFFGFDYCGRESVRRRKNAGGCLELRIKVQSPEEFPHTKDRDDFYAIVDSMQRAPGNVKQGSFETDFRMILPVRGMRQTQGLLKRLSSISAEVEIVFFESDEVSQTLKIENFRLIENYAFGEIDERNFFTVQIEFAEWLRHGFTNEILDRGVISLISNSYNFYSHM